MSVRSSPAMALAVRSPIPPGRPESFPAVYRFRGGKDEPGGALAVRYVQGVAAELRALGEDDAAGFRRVDLRP